MTKPAFTYKQRLKLLEEVYKKGVTVAQACREFGVSRFTFYKWAKRYNPKASIKVNLARLRNKTRKIKRFAGQAPSYIEQEVKRIAANNPSWSKYKIASELERSFGKGILGTHGVYNILKRAGINTLSARERWREFVLKSKKRILTPQERLEVIKRGEDLGVSVAQVCRDFGISRYTFYKWKRRWEKAGKKINALKDKKPHYDRRHLRVALGKEKAILSLVVEYPNLSKYELASKLAEKIGPSVGVHGVYNVLRRHGFSTPEARVAYAEGFYEPSAKAEFGIGQKITYSWNRLIRNLIPLPLPAFSFYTKFVFYLIFGVAVAFATVYSFTWWINHLIAKTPTVALGTVFTTIALGAGTVFFLYSLKYYLSLAIVLSFSQQPSLAKATEGKRRGFLSWILGIANGRGKAGLTTEASAKAVGLTPNLEHVTLERYPKVSVHIPLYNEKTVVERILNAVSSFDYRGDYEVIVADDSNDITTQIIQEYLKANSLKLKAQSGDGWTLTQAEIKPGVVLKHLHRTSRAGFKGGALREALKHTDPKAEFITVFDADFVPYPDTLELFLKYFKVQNSMVEDYSESKVAAVQGYQWHVLNKSENWVTRGVRSEYAGSYVIERSGAEIYTGLKQISGSVYMIRRDVLEEIGWETSITEDFQLTLKLYEKGYKVVYTPYIQAPAECVSTLKRLIRQRMRWAEGHSNNIRRMFTRLIFNKNLTVSEKLEFFYLSPYYLQAFFFLVGTFSWLISETIFPARLPFWTSLWGWSLVLTNFLSLPLMNAVGLFLEESEERDYAGIASFIALSYILVPFQAYAALKGFLEGREGPWFRTPKTGRITDIIRRGTFYRLIAGILPGRAQPAVAHSKGTRQWALGFRGLMPKPYNLNPNPYLALATANSTSTRLSAFSTFNSFTMKPKRARWVGKVATVAVLVSVLFIHQLAFFAPPAEATFVPAWWDTDYLYRKQITITNNFGATVVANTIVMFVADTATLISNSKLRSDGKDWRVVYWNGSAWTELARDVYNGWNTASTETWFRLQANINNGASNGNYYVYYGYSSETTTPSTLGLSAGIISQQTQGQDQRDSAIDWGDTIEYGGAQAYSYSPSNTSWYVVTKISWYVNQKQATSSTNLLAGYIFDAVNDHDGGQITNGKGNGFTWNSVSTSVYNDATFSIPYPRPERATTYYLAILPKDGRAATGAYIRWDYYENLDDGAYNVPRTANWNQDYMLTDSDYMYRLYGYEAPNDDCAYSLSAEVQIPEMVVLLLPVALAVPFILKYYRRKKQMRALIKVIN